VGIMNTINGTDTFYRHYLYNGNDEWPVATADDTVYCSSIFAKAGTRNWLMIYTKTKANSGKSTYFDLTNGVVGDKHDHTSYGIKALGSTGWYRCWASVDIGNGGTTPVAGFFIAEDNNDYNYTASSEEAMTFYGAQVEESPYPTSYIPTSGATAVRWSQEGAVDTTELLGTTNTTGFKLSAASGNSFFQSDDITLTDYAGVLDAELGSNMDFETAGGGGADIWANWDEDVQGDGALANETSIVWSGSDAAKLSSGTTGENTTFTQTISGLTAGSTYQYTFYSRGDGTGALRIAVKDTQNNKYYHWDSEDWQSGGSFLVCTTSTTWTKYTKYLTTDAGCTELRLKFNASNIGANTDVYLDNVLLREVTTAAPAYRITLTDDSSETLVGYIGYPDVAETLGAEIIADQVDRDFSGASDWTNNDINAYDETDDLTITADSADQYCTLAQAEAVMVPYEYHLFEYDCANLVSTWAIGDLDGAFTIETVDAADTNIQKYFCYGDASTGGLRVTSLAADSSMDLDNLSMKAVRHAGTDGVRIYTDENLTTEGWTDSGTNFDFTDTEYDVVIEFIAANGIYYPHASLWPTNWATDMDPEGTMSLEWTPGWSAADVSSDQGLVTIRNTYSMPLGLNTSDDLISYDGTNFCTTSPTNPVVGETRSIVLTWDDDIDANGSLEIYLDGSASGDEEEYDGAFGADINLIIGSDNPYPFHIKNLKFYDTYTKTGYPVTGRALLLYPIFDWPLH